MLRPRIIPCLLVHQKGLVKTVGFRNPVYVGDPINAVKIFNEKEVDELIVLDIDATAENRQPDYQMIEKLAEECRMPLCYGGGVKNQEQVKRIVELGVEKVAISSAAMQEPQLVAEAAECVGNQSVVVVFDVRKKRFSGNYDILTHNARQKVNLPLVEAVQKIERLGAGEIVINSINSDGQMKGYDLHLFEQIRSRVKVPLTLLGGAGSLDDIAALIKKFGIVGASAGSLFVFKGIFKAVLINYPNRLEKDTIISNNLTPSTMRN